MNKAGKGQSEFSWPPHSTSQGFPGGAVVKNLPANAGDIRHASSMPEWERSPGVGNGTPLQYSCLENPMDRGAWWATVHGVTKSQTGLSIHTPLLNSLDYLL